jgi:DNA repair exonuclease SbcCD ATPase subunit
MKLKYIFLLTLVIIISSSEQVFDALDKEIDKIESENKNNTNKMNFIQTAQKNKLNTNNLQGKYNNPTNPTVSLDNPNKSIFDTVNETPIPQNSPVIQPTARNVAPQVTPPVSHNESPIKVLNDQQPQHDNNNITEQISELRKEVQSLAESNQKLMNQFRMTIKPKKSNHHGVSFIQKYDKDINTLKTELATNEEQVKSSLSQKNEEFKRLYDKATQKVDQIKNKMESVSKKVENIKNDNFNNIENLKNNLEVQNLTIENELSANKSNIKHLVAETVDLPGIKLTNGQISVTKDTKLFIDGENVNLADLVVDYNLFHNFLRKCGNNFENCKPIPKQVLDDQEKAQKAILDNLMRLRQQTYGVLKRKSFS